jgi:hypothetical protein
MPKRPGPRKAAHTLSPAPANSRMVPPVKLPALCLAAAFLVAGTADAAPSGAVIREPGAIYLEDLLQRPVRLTVLADAPIYSHSSKDRSLGILRKGQQAELQAVGEEMYRVRGLARQGQVAGWVEPHFLAPLKKEFVENLRQNAARRAEVEALIARNEVAVNMTHQEVLAALGKPARKTSRLDAGGREEVWEFIRFERVPQEVQGYDRFGRLVVNTVYVKVPAGKLSVVFENNLVAALEQTEGALERDARVKIVTAPLVFAE